MKALRLPTRVSAVTYFVRFRRPRDPPIFVSAVALLEELEVPSFAMAVTSILPPLRETTKASDNADFGAHSRSFRTCSPTLRVSCCHLTRKAGFRLAGW